MAKRYTLVPEAVEDLRNIAHYTETKWGHEQSNVYESKLVKSFQTIAEGNLMERPFKGINKDLFFIHCEHHYIFYLRSTNPVTIIAVLHERMDLITEVKKRLLW